MRRGCGSALDPQMDRLWAGGREALQTQLEGRRGSISGTHSTPRPLLLGPSTLSSQTPHKRALCISARRCQMHLYSIALPSPSPKPWHEHRCTRCRKQEARQKPEVRWKSQPSLPQSPLLPAASSQSHPLSQPPPLTPALCPCPYPPFTAPSITHLTSLSFLLLFLSVLLLVGFRVV